MPLRRGPHDAALLNATRLWTSFARQVEARPGATAVVWQGTEISYGELHLYDDAVSLGAKRYLYGAIPDMSTEDWKRHYGDRWSVVSAMKAQFDPDHVLTPGQRIFS